MLFCPTDGGYVCLKCQIGINKVWEVNKMPMECLKCDKCGIIKGLDYDGLKCPNPNCDGTMKPIRIWFPEEGEEVPNDKRSDNPDKPP